MKIFKIKIHPALYIKNTAKKGRGVFTHEKIKRGTIIETSPVLVIPPEKTSAIRETEILGYYYTWMQDKLSGAIVLGYGSLYNHSYKPNIKTRSYYGQGVMVFKAYRDIEAGEELLINYGGVPKSKNGVWFEVEE